jgi:hypothetical protein
VEARTVQYNGSHRTPCIADCENQDLKRKCGIFPWKIRVENQAGERDGAVNGTHLGLQRRESPAAQGVLGFRKNNKNGA